MSSRGTTLGMARAASSSGSRTGSSSLGPGIPEKNFYPCAERHEKTAICAKLGITHFVTIGRKSLGHMLDTVEHLYLFNSSDAHLHEFAAVLPRLHPVASWKELLAELEQ